VVLRAALHQSNLRYVRHGAPNPNTASWQVDVGDTQGGGFAETQPAVAEREDKGTHPTGRNCDPVKLLMSEVAVLGLRQSRQLDSVGRRRDTAEALVMCRRTPS
jgi:hypothetical protein